MAALARPPSMDIDSWCTFLDGKRAAAPSDKTLRDLYADATSKLSVDKFRNDPRLLDIWLEYLRMEANAREGISELRDKYKYLKSRIGATSAKLYLHWARTELAS
ncbi:hypothetical protein HK101_006940, partial [Irineochytrium annulatum]